MVLAEMSLYPLGKGESVGGYVARCVRIVEQSGMEYQCHAMGTTVEGDLDGVMGVVKRCLEELTADCDRVECLVKIDYRKGFSGELTSRVARVEKRVGHSLKK